MMFCYKIKLKGNRTISGHNVTEFYITDGIGLVVKGYEDVTEYDELDNTYDFVCNGWREIYKLSEVESFEIVNYPDNSDEYD